MCVQNLCSTYTYLLHVQLHTIIAVCVATVAFLNQKLIKCVSVYVAYPSSNFAVATYILSCAIYNHCCITCLYNTSIVLVTCICTSDSAHKL